MSRIKVFCCFYNEAPLIPYFLGHYQFADAITAYVSPSLDATRDLLAADPRVQIHDVTMPDGMDDDLKIGFLNGGISQRDPTHEWHIVVDADEFVFPPNDPTGASASSSAWPDQPGHDPLPEAECHSGQQKPALRRRPALAPAAATTVHESLFPRRPLAECRSVVCDYPPGA